MIRSMTGFGRSTFEVQGVGFEVEIRTVNHRHLDIRIKLPRLLAEWEQDVKSAIQAGLQRGKADLSVSMGGDAGTASELEIDMAAAEQYLQAADRLRDDRGVGGSLDISTLLGLPGVTRFRDVGLPVDDLRDALLGAVGDALSALVSMREREGAALLVDFESRLGRIIELVTNFEERSACVVDAARERLRKRSQQLETETGLLDEARLHQEIVIAADRMDISEEIVRLRSHVDQFRGILAEAGPTVPVGRRLDFLLQELGREANTVGSKVADAPLAHDVVELKTELERIREQVQNLE